MESLILLPKIKVEAANAISGIIYGFPAVTHFLGFVHALSRDVFSRYSVSFNKCAIVCHSHQIQGYKLGKDFIFSLTRNPLSKEGKTASFNEEGKIQLELTLIIGCEFAEEDLEENKESFLKFVHEKTVTKRLAGGVITQMNSPDLLGIPQNEEKAEKFFKKILKGTLPGFILKDRSDFLKEHLEKNPELSNFEALIDFYSLKSRSMSTGEYLTEQEKATWEFIPKPYKGWLVPIQVGYKGISPLYDKDNVECARDRDSPFRFVEAAYSIAEWLNPLRINNYESIFWEYQYTDQFYICVNNK